MPWPMAISNCHRTERWQLNKRTTFKLDFSEFVTSRPKHTSTSRKRKITLVPLEMQEDSVIPVRDQNVRVYLTV